MSGLKKLFFKKINLTLKVKLFGAGIILSALLCTILALTVFFFGNLERGFQQIVDTSGRGVLKSQSADTTISVVNDELTSMTGRMGEISDAINTSNMNVKITARKIKALSAELNDITETIDGVYEDLEDGEIRDSLADVADDVGDMQEKMKREALIGLDLAVSELQQFTIDITALSTGTQQLAEKLASSKTMSNDVMKINTGIQQQSIGFKSVISKNKNFLGIVILTFTICVLMLSFVFARSISVPLGQAVEMLHEMSKGHLDKRLRLTRNDEIGQMANTMDGFADDLQLVLVRALEHLATGDVTFEVEPKDERDVIGNSLYKTREDLNRIVNEILIATEQIDTGSGQVSDSSQALSEGATESAAALEQINSSMTHLASQTTTNAENATQVSVLARQAKSFAENGNTQMDQMVAAMAEINGAAQNISKIIKVIDEIAFQTNLLALNAAVEAARAGRHGKGFAVVAEEVRNLAVRSAKAAKETAALIEGSVGKTNNGTDIAAQTAESLSEIVTAVTKVTDLIGEIAAASNEQAEGIAQINSGLGQIDQVTQQNTASAEEGAAAAVELSSQAGQLKELMATFTVRQNGEMIEPVRPAVLDC